MGGYAKDDKLGKFPSEIPFGLQFNTCITDFTPENGGTCFRLGSRDLNHHPNWGAYAGEGASQFRAPAGTVILCASRFNYLANACNELNVPALDVASRGGFFEQV